MAVRIAIGLVLLALFALGTAVLLYGTALHFQFTDASDPPIWAIQRSLWLSYLLALDLLWGASAGSLLWPGQRSARLRRVLGLGAIAAGSSGGALLASSYMHGAGALQMQLAGLILFGATAAGFGQSWLYRQAAA